MPARIVGEQDPFGGRRASTWSGELAPAGFAEVLAWQNLRGSRGFTANEHLNRTGFIHMNGRVYDPRIGRFVSPDPVVQLPTFSQSYNRYSYALNNPLSYTDPSGFFLKKLFKGIGKLFKGVATAIGNVVRGVGRVIRKYGWEIAAVAACSFGFCTVPAEIGFSWGRFAGSAGAAAVARGRGNQSRAGPEAFSRAGADRLERLCKRRLPKLRFSSRDRLLIGKVDYLGPIRIAPASTMER